MNKGVPILFGIPFFMHTAENNDIEAFACLQLILNHIGDFILHLFITKKGRINLWKNSIST